MSVFSDIGIAYKKRAMHNLSHEVLQTQKMGALCPMECLEVLPGDRIKFNTEMVVRLSPLLAPIMSQIDVTTHYWFVPNRIIWDDWEEFITGGKDNNPTTAPVAPYINLADSAAYVGSLADYLGIPPGGTGADWSGTLKVSALPFRAYNAIWNEWYRDENLDNPINFSKASGLDNQTSVALRYRCWNKDRFTSALPWPQRGPAASIPLSSTSAPVKGNGLSLGLLYKASDGNLANGTLFNNPNNDIQLRCIPSYTSTVGANPSESNVPSGTIGVTTNPNYSGLVADLSNATATDIRTIRQAFQLQLWAELSARAGYRYVENTLAHFGVRIPDSRLQRPEYLGGGKSPVVVSEVLQTSSTDNTSPQGNMSGHGFSAQRSHGFSKTFVEHGFVIAIVNVQPKTMYQQGLDRMWFARETKEGYFWSMFEHIGEEAIFGKELFLRNVSSTDDSVFGYQPRYQEYRQKENQVRGQFRTTLSYWHTGRIFANMPTLSSGFVQVDPTALNRINAVSGQDNIYLNIYHKIHALRPVGRRGNPGLIDHKG